MRKTLFFTKALTVLILSSTTIQPIVASTNTKQTVTLIKRTKNHSNTADQNGHRAPSCPVIVHLSPEEGVSSPSFDTEDVISYLICNTDSGESIYYTCDSIEFTNFLFDYQESVLIQIEFDKFYFEGIFEL